MDKIRSEFEELYPAPDGVIFDYSRYAPVISRQDYIYSMRKKLADYQQTKWEAWQHGRKNAVKDVIGIVEGCADTVEAAEKIRYME